MTSSSANKSIYILSFYRYPQGRFLLKMTRFWSPKKRAKAITLHEEGYSLKDIAAELGEKSTFSGVTKLLLKYTKIGKLDDKKRCGRKRKTSDREDRVLKRLSLNNRRLTSNKAS